MSEAREDIKKDEKTIADWHKEVTKRAKARTKQGVAFLKKVPTPIYYTLGGIALYHLGIKPILKDARSAINTDPGNDEFQDNKDQVYGRDTGDGSKYGTLSDQEIQSLANAQLSYMDRPGTNNKVLSDLQGLSGKDLQRVYVAFGKKWYDPLLGVQSGSLFSWVGHHEEDLFGWYRGELSDSELNQMSEIWKNSGLRFPTSGDDSNSTALL